MTARHDIYVTDAGEAVSEITEGGGFLLAAQGGEIDPVTAKHYGLRDGAVKAVKPSEDKAVKPKADKSADKSG